MQFKFRRLVNAHHRLVYSIAYRFLANTAEAEELAQDVYERAWKHIEKIDEGDAAAWLSRVTRNAAIDRLRARRPETTLDETEELECQLVQPSQALEQLQLSRWLKSAISQLQEPYRSLIVMVDLQQKPIKQAAAAIALSENQVKVYCHRARKQLKELMRAKP